MVAGFGPKGVPDRMCDSVRQSVIILMYLVLLDLLEDA